MSIEDFNHHSESRKKVLKERSKRCVCKYCGAKLRLKQIIFSDFDDSRVELYCECCGRIEFGVEPEIYQTAKYFVDAMEFNIFTQMDDNERTKHMTIAKVCEIIAWSCNHLGYLNKDGFLKAPTINLKNMDECTIYTEADFEKK